MSQLIYVYGDDARMLETLLSALRAGGYSLEYTELEQEGLSDAIAADVALICRTAGGGALLSLGALRLDGQNRTVWRQEEERRLPLHVTRNEFALLRYLMENEGRAVSRAELLPRIWGIEQGATSTRVADDTVKRLRKKLAGTGVEIETVWGFGFKLVTV